LVVRTGEPITSHNDAEVAFERHTVRLPLIARQPPLLRVRPEFQEFCRFGGDWTSPHGGAQAGCAYFHILTRGECAIDGPSHSAIRLQTGDILLLPHGNAHVLHARIGSAAVGNDTRSDQPDRCRYRLSVRSSSQSRVPSALWS
jgi:hypothetical protein